ncbi:hypothetical protein HIM_10816 [Hirsutella minnesotensis 3608]|uniref:C2H2-type domain-containing protein n=1 Tax=Hirsutella minnesotensis 3608 TaxID=1043627 RepID=A0A0F7ZRL0_9HYPO|nr:hypothetical protein HIM_10816 [Hirsutella minnesotensis 3608]
MADDDLFSRLRLRIEPRARLLICADEKCGFALSSNPSQVSVHLRLKHEVSVEDRREIGNLLKGRQPPLVDPVDAPLRSDKSPRDPRLRLFSGFACKFCSFRSINRQSMTRHIATEHERQRLDLCINAKAMFDPVHLQTWTRSPAKGRYWLVENHGSIKRPVGGKEVHAHLKDVFDRERQRQQAPDKDESFAAPAGFTNLRPWLERTGWEQTYTAVDRTLLRNLTTAPPPSAQPRALVLGEPRLGSAGIPQEPGLFSSLDDERKIASLLTAVEKIMDRCEHTARTAGRNILCWLRSVRRDGCYAKPFTFVNKVASRRKYIRLLKRFVAMIFRAYRLPTDVRRQKAGIYLKRSQLDMIAGIWHHSLWDQSDAKVIDFRQLIPPCDSAYHGKNLDVEADEETSSPGDGNIWAADADSDGVESDSGSENEEDDDPDRVEETVDQFPIPREESLQQSEMLERLFGLIMAFSTQEIVDGRPPSALLVYFSGILGFSADCTGFLPAKLYTTSLAGLIYIQRLLFLELALPAGPYPYLGLPRRPRNDQVARLQEVHRMTRMITQSLLPDRPQRLDVRHIVEKHVREISRPFNRFDDRSEAADRSVTFAWQSGHRPLQRARTYGLDGAFPTQLQPQLLERYEWASTRWHEFLHLPTKLCQDSTCDLQSKLQAEEDVGGAANYEGRPGASAMLSVPPQPLPPADVPTVAPSATHSPLDRTSRTKQSTPRKESSNEAVSSPTTSDEPQRPLNGLGQHHAGYRCAGSIFGHKNEVNDLEEAEEQQRIIAYLRGKHARIRILGARDREFVFPADNPDDDEDKAMEDSPRQIDPVFAHSERLERIHEITESWRFVGCELCYVTSGQREPDHDLCQCTQWPESLLARTTLQWLESLDIPRYLDHRGDCSMCGHGCVPCDEMRSGNRIHVLTHSPHDQLGALLIKEYDSKKGTDGFCKNKPVVRRMIAALCSCDNRYYSTILAKMALSYDGVNLASNAQAKSWFEQRIWLPQRAPVSRLVYALEQLLMAFNFRQPKRRVLRAPFRPRISLARWDNELEVQDWMAALAWLKGKCTFCAGRGLGGQHIDHTLRQCKRGGAAEVWRGLGEMFYEEEYLPSNGCGTCRLPRDCCPRWNRDSRGEWAQRYGATCRYEGHLLCDGIIGFATCGIRRFLDDIYDGIESYSGEAEGRVFFNDEMAAIWLVQPIVVAGVEGTEMLRQLAIWTRGLKAFHNVD